MLSPDTRRIRCKYFFVLLAMLLIVPTTLAQNPAGEPEPTQQLQEISDSLKDLVEILRGMNPSDTSTALTMQLEMMDRMVIALDSEMLSLHAERDKLAKEKMELESKLKSLTRFVETGSSTEEHRAGILEVLPEHNAALERNAERQTYVSRRIEDLKLDLQMRQEIRSRLEKRLLEAGES